MDAPAEKKSKFQFFGKVDRDEKGRITSEYPAWYFREQILNLQEEVNRDEGALKRGMIPRQHVEGIQEGLTQNKKRLEEIEEGRPTFDVDKLAKLRAELGEELTRARFTYDEVYMRKADAHEEARRMVEPCVKLNPEIAEAFSISLVNGRASRNNADRAWKIISRALGEPSNTAYLQKTK